jgi:hypothetical protein
VPLRYAPDKAFGLQVLEMLVHGGGRVNLELMLYLKDAGRVSLFFYEGCDKIQELLLSLR